MQLDTDYLDGNRRAKVARWRARLAALALVACAIMFGDLVAQAQPADNVARATFVCENEVSSPPLSEYTLSGENHPPVFNFTGQTLCSAAD